MAGETLALEVENVGGIREADRTLSAGITFIQGPNASNKSSFLRAVLFALGARHVPIRSGAKQASVRLAIGDRSVERTARRTDEGLVTDGEPWIEDEPVLLERFAGLLGTNDLRTAVAMNEPVEELLKEPMDVEALEAERAAKLQRKRQLVEELSASEDVDERLAGREREVADRRERLEAIDERLEGLHEQQDEAVADGDLEDRREERADLRSRERECESAVDGLEEAIDRLTERRAEIEADLEAAREAGDETDVAALKREREAIRSDLEETRERLDVLQAVLTANRELLDSPFAGVLGSDAGLVEDDLRCWTCGQATTAADVEATIAELQDLVEADKRRLRETEPEIDDLTERIEQCRDREREIQELEADLEEVDGTLSSRRESLGERRGELADVRDRLADVDAEIEHLETDRQSTNAALTEEIEEARVERRTVARQVDRLESEIESLESTVAERRRKRETVDTITEEIGTLTDRIENLEAELRTVFNDAMDDLIAALDFRDIERVWLDGEFDVVVTREVGGSVRRDTVEHLAESEREMIGLVLGLAGFVTYEVDDVSPVLLVDSLGAFDAERTRRLVEYFADRTDFLVAAAHPEPDVASGFDTIGIEPAGAD
jgi:DNA repair exonuclease SbcCD ATPase subunit